MDQPTTSPRAPGRPDADHAARLAALGAACRLDEALALFDDLPGVAPEELSGTWTGRELATGHPLDGLLGASGWYGKRFDGPDAVHPLLLRTRGGGVVSADPRRVPLRLADVLPRTLVDRALPLVPVLAPLLATRRPRARLRRVVHRGVATTAMLYDHLPIVDVFRRVDADTLLGCMDRRETPAPYLFVLTR